MPIKIAGKLRGTNPGEQLMLEQKRFKARQDRSRNKIKPQEEHVQNKFNMEENL